MAVIITCLLYATHCDNCFTYILSLTPRSLVTCTSLVPFCKRKLRLTGCSIPVQNQTLFSELRVSRGKLQCEVAGMSRAPSSPSAFQASLHMGLHQSLSPGPACWARGQGGTLTLCVRDGAGDRGAGGGDGAQGGAHAVGREGASHGCSVGDPGRRVNGPDGLACGEDEELGAAHPAQCWAQQGRCEGSGQHRRQETEFVYARHQF